MHDMSAWWMRGRVRRWQPLRFVTKGLPGQAVIMFALVLVPLVGMLGLAVDGGVYLYARRTAQAAADAAALAGARQLAKGNNAQADVEAVVAANGQGSVTPSVLECRYVDDNNQPVGGGATCGTPPDTASGVFVRTQETVPTFFMSVIPGAPASTVTEASASARVRLVSGLTADAPFIVCGSGSWIVSEPGMDTMSILLDDDPFTINPDAIGETFRIWDSQLAKEGAGCGEGNSFKGVANSEENQDRTTPSYGNPACRAVRRGPALAARPAATRRRRRSTGAC
jgi:Flp pilus assembly protein TadG